MNPAAACSSTRCPPERMRAGWSARRVSLVSSSSSRARASPAARAPAPERCARNAVSRFSVRLIAPKTRATWNERTRPSEAICAAPRPARLRPLKNTSPDVGASTPVIKFVSVVLPAPFGPMTPRISPAATLRATSLLAVKPPKRFVRARVSSSGAIHASLSFSPKRPLGFSASTMSRTRKP